MIMAHGESCAPFVNDQIKKPAEKKGNNVKLSIINAGTAGYISTLLQYEPCVLIVRRLRTESTSTSYSQFAPYEQKTQAAISESTNCNQGTQLVQSRIATLVNTENNKDGQRGETCSSARKHLQPHEETNGAQLSPCAIIMYCSSS